jgi:DNA-binding transcriptional MerR regulator
LAVAKGPDAFRTISEASEELGVPQHVLRFWESKFSFIRPMKRAGGRRFYRRQDLDVLRGVRVLLHDEGYTIKGVQKLHKEMGVGRVVAAGDPVRAAALRSQIPTGHVLSERSRKALSDVLADLESVKARIDALVPPGSGTSEH